MIKGEVAKIGRNNHLNERSLVNSSEILNPFEEMIENSPDLIIRVDRELRLLYVNKSIEREFAISWKELIGRTLLECDGIEGYSLKWERAVKTVFATKEEGSIEIFYPSPHGFKYFHIRLVPELNTDGNINSVLSIGRNITKVKAGENQRSILFNTSTDLLGIFSLKGDFLNYNPVWEKLLGYSSEELSSRSLLQLIHQEEKDIVADVISRFYEGEVMTNIQFRCYCKDGSSRWLSWNFTPLVEEGVIHAVANDITERRRIEDKLKQSEERYRLLVEASPDGMVMIANEKIKYANPAAAKLVKMHSSDELINRGVLDFIEDGEYKKLLEEYCTKKKSYLSEIRLRDIEGNMVDVEISPITLPYDEEKAIICVVRDITARKRNEELQRAIAEKEKKLKEALELDRLRTDFFSNISHEFKTPLNVILGTLQLITLYLKDKASKPFEKKMIRKINTMKQNCYRLLRLVNNLIDINRIDAGYYEINQENHDIVKVVKDITLSVKDYIENKEIKLSFKTRIKNMVIACDPDKIERIMLNLLSNAIKHTSAGGNISVVMKNTKTDIYISIKDTGTGIPKEKLDLIFERFSQVDKSLVRKNQGSGIGLALVKSLVEMHHGDVCVKSQEGSGTEFIIRLPMKSLENSSFVTEGASSYSYQKQIEQISIEFSDIYIQKNH